jgi:hypothetical protein
MSNGGPSMNASEQESDGATRLAYILGVPLALLER